MTGGCAGPEARRVGPVRTGTLQADAGWRAAHGQSVPGESPDGAAGEVLLVDSDGPVAIAEPRDGAVLKPIVGFRA